MDYARAEGLEASMLSIGMDKACDKEEWSYILLVLERFGFGPRFRRMVATLFGNASTTILVNGVATRSYELC
eukprot:c32363_g1_i1 orf=1-213(-)